MKKRTLVAICMMAAAVSLLYTCEDSDTMPSATLETTKDSLSYAWGIQFAEALKQRTTDLDPDVVAAAVKEALEDNARMTVQQCQEVITDISQRERAEAMVKNAAEGEAFLEENATKPGVEVTASGLQYKRLQEGEGESPTATSTVTVHYTGKLLDGTKFDSSYDRGQPSTFPLNRVIRGWTEGLQLLKPGGKLELYIKPELGYGASGSQGSIPPNATLIFEVELISFEN